MKGLGSSSVSTANSSFADDKIGKIATIDNIKRTHVRAHTPTQKNIKSDVVSTHLGHIRGKRLPSFDAASIERICALSGRPIDDLTSIE